VSDSAPLVTWRCRNRKLVRFPQASALFLSVKICLAPLVALTTTPPRGRWREMRGQFVGDQVVLERALPFLIHACYQQIRSLTYKEFLGHGLELTPEQWVVLVQLWRKDGQSQSALSELTLRDRPTMSRILDTMEKGGLIQRVVDERDARSRLVRLTRAGKALQAKLVPVAKQLVLRLERGIAQADLEVTHRTLQRMFENTR
jgi:DNA-binding MarR family transcriptional regulator